MDVSDAHTLHLGQLNVESNNVPAAGLAKQVVPAVSPVGVGEETSMVVQNGSFHDSLSVGAEAPLGLLAGDLDAEDCRHLCVLGDLGWCCTQFSEQRLAVDDRAI